MPDAGLLLTLPAQSVTVRLLLGAVVAVLGARLLLRAGLRVPRIRVGAALLPGVVLLVILVVSLGHYRLPSLMLPNSGAGSVLLPIENTYAYLAPMALPALLGAWMVVAALRVGWRLHHARRMSRDAARTALDTDVPAHVRQVLHRMATRMELDAPPVGLIDDCSGGATVVGIRRPTIVVDRQLLDRLDPQELEGVLAHELAHVRRRDNLVALLLSVLRDVVFFVPGGRWALRQLLVERELAADQLAVDTTRRPGALAAGLLKVIEGEEAHAACAALAPPGTLVRRVSNLVDEQPALTRTRTAGELTALGVTFALVLTAATTVPWLVTGGDPDGGLGLLVTAPRQSTTVEPDRPAAQPRVFETYRRSALQTGATSTATTPTLDDDPHGLRRTTLAACTTGGEACAPETARATLALRPRPRVEVDRPLEMRWHARPMVDTGDVLRLYWLSTIQ